MKEIFAKGQTCPIPVIWTKNAYDQGERHIRTEVDNAIACENLRRFATHLGGHYDVETIQGGFAVTLQFGDAVACPACELMELPTTGTHGVFCTKEVLGSGDDQLGANLMAMFFYTLAASDNPPAAICLMNGGVWLATENDQVKAHLQTLLDRGVEVLVCGTCLNFFGLENPVGQVSNMYEIVSKLEGCSKVMSL
ncbi:sulfurtransferase-like selenium metabolism protein YedF [Bengtsoniella intestinalis]|uniref:sulfurtransferase-like selenium metabolism protein YedF n=1 Tax=Bengtsoniella intestinalis TaxID=3073143 RepID=UPI00391F05EF